MGVLKCHDSVGHHQNLLNYPRADDIITQPVHKVQQPRDENVVREDDVFLKEGPEA